jgi:hypothetical protein
MRSDAAGARRPSRTLLASLIGLAVLGLFWQSLLLGVAAFMRAASPLPDSADVILPLYHEADSVSAAVADLYERELAPRVVLHRKAPGRLEELGLLPRAHNIWRRLLEARGVPAGAIEIVGPDLETTEELGRVVGGLAAGPGRLRVIVVASSPVSRLARGKLMRGLEGAGIEVTMWPVTPRGMDERAWWRSRAGWIAYFDAYCLWLVGLVR